MATHKFICKICTRGPSNPAGKGVTLYRYEKAFYCEKDLIEKIGMAHFELFMIGRQQRQYKLQAFLTIPPSGYICDECGL